MRHAIAVLALLLSSITASFAQVSVSIGINLPVYPQLVRVPGYPVYYAPSVSSNYFFYDGMYWVYVDDNWYASTWYNGPWEFVAPDFVPLYVLRVPVRYYRRPPVYFRGWRYDAPPRWGEHWGNSWYENHRGWDTWNRRAAPAPAPLPVYQRQYSGNRYPRADQQAVLQTRNYRYEPRDATVQRHYQAQRAQMPATSAQQRIASPAGSPSHAARPPSSPQARPPRAEQRTAESPPPHSGSSAAERRGASQAPRPPTTAQPNAAPRPPAAQSNAASRQPTGQPNAAPRQPTAQAYAEPRASSAQPNDAARGEPPSRPQRGEQHGNGRGPQAVQDKKPD